MPDLRIVQGGVDVDDADANHPDGPINVMPDGLAERIREAHRVAAALRASEMARWDELLKILERAERVCQTRNVPLVREILRDAVRQEWSLLEGVGNFGPVGAVVADPYGIGENNDRNWLP